MVDCVEQVDCLADFNFGHDSILQLFI